MPLVDYKAKYLDLKTKFQETVDLAWRLGFEQGAQQAQLDQVAQQQQQADQMAMAANGQPQPGQPGEESQQPGNESEGQPEQPQSQNPNGDELDQHIAKLEGMLGKSEIDAFQLQDLKKTLNDIRSLQVQINLTKSMDSIKNTKMGKLHKSITFTPKLQANLPEQSKKALTKQQEIVEGVFKKWAADESKATSDISSILNAEGITKKDGDHEK